MDAFTYPLNLVAAEIIHHHHISRFKRRTEYIVEIGKEYLPVGGGLDGHGGDHSLQTHRAQNGEYFPVALWRGLVNAAAAQAATATPRHAHHDPAFVQENQPFWRNGQDVLVELGAPCAVGLAVALDGMERLFLRRRPSR